MEILERAAEAIRNELCDYSVGEDEWMAEGGLRPGEHYRDIVRAVLVAIREPSEAMLVAGLKAPNYIEDVSSRRGCANIFAAMIDAALKEGPEQ